MRTLLLPLLLLAAALAGGCGGSAPRDPGGSPAARAAAEADLLRITEQTIAALEAGDRAFFEALLADDYLGTAVDGRVVDRAEFFATFSPPPASIQPRFEVVEPRVTLHGETAVLNARRNFRAVINGRPVAQSERTTQIFVRSDGRWRLLAEHSSPLPPPAG